MAQNYTRQSTFADGDTISASLFNDEYNQLVNTFTYSSTSASSTGHRHDGSSGQGGNIFKIGDLDFLNKIEVDSTNNRWGFYVEVSGSAVEQLRIQDGAIVPVTDNDIDLGTSTLEFKDLYIDGTANVDVLNLNGTDVTATAAELNILDGVTATANELNILDGVTSTTAELNILDGVTATATEINLLDGVTATTAELNILDGVTSTATELNILDGVTATTAELNILDGVTSTASELNLVDGSVAGTVTNSKAVIYGTAGEVNATTLQVGGVAITSTPAELNVLDGITATTAELNILDGVTATAAELNILDGVTATATELNLLDGVTATTAELNILDGVTSTTAELNLVDGSVAGTVTNSKAVVYGTAGEVNATTLQVGGVSITSTPAELNLLDGVTATTAELNILDGVTATATELNILDGVTATTAELNIMDGVTATTAELNYVDGVTSAIQTQIDTKAPTASPTFTGAVTVPGLTTTGNVSFGDNDKIQMGAGPDLEIYHDGTSTNYISSATSNLEIKVNGGGNFKVGDEFGNHLFIVNDNGDVQLKHGSTPALKLATTSTGIDVTGTVNSDGLTVSSITYPTTDGTNGQVLTTDGAGTLSFADAGGGFDPDVDSFNIGNDAVSSGTNSVALGHDTDATGTGSVALGMSAQATATGATALGYLADATATYAISIGDSDAQATYAIAIGGNAQANTAATYGIAIGYNAKAQAANAIHINSSSSQTNRPTVAGNMVIETDDARLQYKSSKWSFFGGPVEMTTTGASGGLTVISTDAGSSGAPDFTLYRNSASPADDDVLGVIFWNGKDSGDTNSQYAYQRVVATDVTAGSEDARMDFNIATNGSVSRVMELDGTGVDVTGTVVTDDLLVGVDSSSSGAKIVSKADGAYVAGLEVRSQGGGSGEWARINLVNEEHSTNVENAGLIYYDQDGVLGIRNNNSSGTAQVTQIIAGNTTSGTIMFRDTITTEVARFDSGGLKFNGDSAHANGLDDYEEGSFTPTFAGTTTTGAFTYSTQTGRYTKIGRQVTFLIELSASAKTTDPAGNFRIAGLPFAASSSYNGHGGAVTYAANFGNTNHPDGVALNAGSTQLVLRKRQSADARDDILTAVAAADVGTQVQIKMIGTYYV